MAKRLTTNQQWRRILGWLRREHPLECRATVRRPRTRPPDNLAGYCYRFPSPSRRFDIVVARNQCFALQVDTLIHEWAHALTWHWDRTWQNEHSSNWGIAYAQLYRAFLQWDYGRGPQAKEPDDGSDG